MKAVAMYSPYGWKAKIGLIVPSTNTIMEPEFWRLAPAGITIHTSRALLLGQATGESYFKMAAAVDGAAEELATAEVDHSTISRWTIRCLSLLEKILRQNKRPVGGSWRVDGTHIKVRGQWKYLYRPVDKERCTINFLPRAKRGTAAATRFFEKAVRANADPEKVTMDKSGANKAAIDGINKARDVPIVVRQIKYLDNIIEQDH